MWSITVYDLTTKILATYDYTVKCISSARQQLGKHYLKAGITEN
jgi:hypothetical protein